MVRTKVAVCVLTLTLAGIASAQPRPVVERIQPTSGPPGTQLQIIGRRLGNARIFLGNQELQVLQRLPNRWTVVVPANAPSGSILIRTRRGEFAGPYFRVTAARPGPQITGLQPASGPPGSEVRILGSNFSPRIADNIVFLNDRPVVVRSATPTSLQVIVPSGATSGSFTVRVLHAGETVSPPFAVGLGTGITSVEPPMAPVGATVVIRGTGFSPRIRDNRVYLNNRRVRVRGATPTELTVIVPRRATTGTLLVDVRGAGRANSSIPFTVQERPLIRDFAPASGPPGTMVVIRGQNFGADPRAVRVSLAGRPLPVRAVVPDHIDVEIPPGVRTGPFEVSIHGLTVSSRGRFVPAQPLELYSFEPRSGGAGTIVTFRGRGFSPRPQDNVVTLSGVGCQVISATQSELRVRVPSAPSGAFTIQSGQSATTTRQPFGSTTPPFIASFDPRSGPVGTLVTIRGSNFGHRPGLVRVEMGRQPLAVQSASDSQIQVVIPPGARRGRIAVTVGMQGGAVTPEDFVVEAHRQVSSLTPSVGYAGTQVVIRGQGFPRRGARIAFTGAPPVAAQRISPVELRAQVPARATTGPVTIVLPNGRTMPAGTFQVQAVPAGTAITTVSPQCAYPGCRATLVGYGFSPNQRFNRVRFNGRPVPVEAATPTTLQIVLPDHPGNGRFEVIVRRGGTGQSPPFMILRR
ncbi:MAG: IPT/TIG domain-containing protein [Myxococcota bacterium]